MPIDILSTIGPDDKAFYSAQLLAAIFRERPDLRDQAPYSLVGGRSAHTIMIGDEIFKGPQSSYGHDVIRGEIENLSRLQNRDLPVPEITHVGKTYAFYGMKRCKGVPVAEVFNAMGARRRKDFAGKMGLFMAGMAEALADPRKNKLIEQDDQNTRDLYFDLLNSERVRRAFGRDYDFIKGILTKYIEHGKAKLTITYHADLHSNNILAEEGSNGKFSVIDFGNVQQTLPEWSFHSSRLTEHFGAGFEKSAWKAYAAAKPGADPRDYYCDKLCTAIIYSGLEVEEKVKPLIRSLKAIGKLKDKSSGMKPCP